MDRMGHEIEKWLSQRPLWMQHAAKLLVDGCCITGADMGNLVSICKSEAGILTSNSIRTSVGAPIISLTRLEGGQNGGSCLRLKSIEDVKGINALAPRKPLDLGSQNLTIIYGQNGSGKSGYVRVLKHACGSRNNGKLLHNVFDSAGTSQAQGCRLKFMIGSEPREVEWTPSCGQHGELSCIELYDTDSAHVYVTQENELAYEPWVLSMFRQLTDLCGEVAQEIRKEIEGAVSRKPTMPAELAGTENSTWYGNLQHRIPESEIDMKCSWSEAQEKELVGLTQRLAEPDPAQKARSLRTTHNSQTAFEALLSKMRSQLSDEMCSGYLAARSDAEAKRKTADEDARKIFENAPLDGIGSESWKLLWEQARVYSESVAYRADPFPNVTDGARCVLCLQFLDDEAKIRLQSFEQFIKGELEKLATSAEGHLKDLWDHCGDIPDAAGLNLLMDSSGISDEAERAAIILFCDALRKRKSTLQTARSFSELAPLPEDSVVELLKKRAEDLAAMAASLDEDAKGDNREALRKRTRELQALKWLSQQRQSIRDEVARLRLVNKLEEALGLTNTKALSTKSSALAESLITKAHVERFKAELRKLGASRIRIDIVKTKAAHGHVYHQLKLRNCDRKIRTADVLSEGEYRIVSLAAFLADVECQETKNPIIFDDPISSLDQDFEEATAARLVELCKSRQVIVFTHRLSLLALLQDFAGREQITPHVICLRSEHWGMGEPGDIPIFAKKPDKALKTLLNERLPKARKLLEQAGHSEYEPLAKAICSDMRILLERLIEIELLADVVHRFRRAINTMGKIEKLARIRQEDCQLFDDLMTKYSRYEHSQSNEAPVRPPEPQELADDLTRVINWTGAFKGR